MANTTTTVRFRNMFAGLRSTRRKYKAAGYLREHIARFNNVSPEAVKIDSKLNDHIMGRILSTGDSIKVEIAKNGDILNVKLPGAPAAPYVAPAKAGAKPSEAAKPQESQPAKKPAEQQKAKPAAKDQKPKEQKKEKPKAQPASGKAAAQEPGAESKTQ